MNFEDIIPEHIKNNPAQYTRFHILYTDYVSKYLTDLFKNNEKVNISWDGSDININVAGTINDLSTSYFLENHCLTRITNFNGVITDSVMVLNIDGEQPVHSWKRIN